MNDHHSDSDDIDSDTFDESSDGQDDLIIESLAKSKPSRGISNVKYQIDTSNSDEESVSSDSDEESDESSTKSNKRKLIRNKIKRSESEDSSDIIEIISSKNLKGDVKSKKDTDKTSKKLVVKKDIKPKKPKTSKSAISNKGNASVS
jgi:hypothetical protein